MTDEQLYAVLFPMINSLKTAYSIGNTTVMQGYQRSRNTEWSTPAIIIHKLFDRRRGFVGVTDSIVSNAIVRTETVEMETHYQATGFGSSNGVTASDILNRLAMMLQSSAALRVFQTAGIGILRIGDIRATYFRDAEDLDAQEPSFDFVLTHQHVFVSSEPKVDDFELSVLRI